MQVDRYTTILRMTDVAVFGTPASPQALIDPGQILARPARNRHLHNLWRLVRVVGLDVLLQRRIPTLGRLYRQSDLRLCAHLALPPVHASDRLNLHACGQPRTHNRPRKLVGLSLRCNRCEDDDTVVFHRNPLSRTTIAKSIHPPIVSSPLCPAWYFQDKQIKCLKLENSLR